VVFYLRNPVGVKLMQVDIPYGHDKIKIDVSDPFEVILPKEVEIKDQDKLIEEALENPIGIDSFDDFIEYSSKLLVIINDATRPTPTSKILKYLLPVLSSHPDVKFLIASGAHRASTEEEIRYILGDTYEVFRRKIYIHNARKKEDLVYIGKTKNGTEVSINKLAIEYENILVVGSLEPHYFAGCTGGRKAFLPGISSFKTIEMNHKYALSENACFLKFEDNPIHQDMTEAVKLLKNLNIFSIQTVLDFNHNIYAITSGDIIESFNTALDFVKDVYCISIKEKGNIVISVVNPPMDINLYQSQHAIENANLILEEGGVIILVSRCHTGVGSDTFIDLLSKANNPEDVMDLIGGKYKLESHKSIRILNIKSKSHIFAVTDLNENIIEKSKMKPYKTIQTAVDEAIDLVKEAGKKPKIIIIPDGSHTIPYIK